MTTTRRNTGDLTDQLTGWEVVWLDGTRILYASSGCAGQAVANAEIYPDHTLKLSFDIPHSLRVECPLCWLPWGECPPVITTRCAAATTPVDVNEFGTAAIDLLAQLSRFRGLESDYACQQCSPYSTALIEGFLCGRHRLAEIVARWEAELLSDHDDPRDEVPHDITGVL